jgi:hypothetical protein
MSASNNNYRVVQWATGNLGRAAIEGVLSHHDLELAGVWVHSPDKVGRDAGELSGHPELTTGITAINDIDAVIDLAPDAVIYSPLLPNEDEIVQLLSAGINVITPLGWFYPAGLDTSRIDQACEQGGATLHGTGIHPGGMTEKLPLVMSGFSREISFVSCDEFSDVRTYGAPDVLHHIMLFGKSREEAGQSSMLRFMGSGFCQSIRMVADALGFELDESFDEQHDIALATAPIESPMGVLEPGQVAAQRFTWHGMVNGTPVIRASVNWYMGTRNIEEDWFDGESIREKGECYEMHVEGDPPVHVLLHGVHPSAETSWQQAQERNAGMVATAMHCVNSVPAVCEADAGIKTYLDLPLINGRAGIS